MQAEPTPNELSHRPWHIRQEVAAWLTHPFVAAGLILLAVALLYGHTLQVPFYLDDTRGLIENFPLRDLQAATARLFSQRGLTNLTFAINYRLGGWSLPSLHLVNILLHAGCGLLVWRILLRLLGGSWLALPGALLFVAHPLQTQGVTYLIQRSTVLAAFLFLLAFLLFLCSRQALADGSGRRAAAYLRPYLGAVLAGIGAALAKEHTATLVLVLLVWIRLFPLPGGERWRDALCDLLPFAVVPVFLGAGLVMSLAGGESARVFHYPIASLQHNSPLNYLATQCSVIWIYLRLLVLPYSQALEHNYPIAAELVTLPAALGLAGLLAVGWAVWRVRHSHPLLTFGAAWFFLTLAVESSIIPLDPLFEHRLYLPMFGLVLVLATALAAWPWRRWAWSVPVLVLVLCVYSVLTWQRNALWRDPIAFYEQNLRVAPDSERAVQSLAHLYGKARRHDERWQVLEQTVQRYPESFLLYGDLARLLAATGQWQPALALLETGMARAPWQTMLYEAAAVICKESGDGPRAIGYLRRGAAAKAANRGRLLNTLGVYYSDAGATKEAEQVFRAALALPANATDRANTYLNLAREYHRRKLWREAYENLQMVLQLNPGDPVALEHLGEMALRLGERDAARRAADKLEHADPQGWHRLQAAISQADRPG